MTQLPIRLGLTMWSHSQWQASFYGSGTKPAERLAKYSQVFHTVEGNTTFYATPSMATIQNWQASTPDEFRFTFKLPKEITHQQMLRHSQQSLKDFLIVMQPLWSKIGQWTIQLPAAFSPADLPILQKFCQGFPPEMKLGIEVRHLGFFNKNNDEKRFNQWLVENNINRIIMDSRPVFSAPPTTEAVREAHRNKPKVPAHAIATSTNPMIRFIGHPDIEANVAFFQPWLTKLSTWIQQGKQPYLMIHTPDNVEAPELALKLYGLLQQDITLQQRHTLPPLSTFPNSVNSPQIDMF